MKATDDLLDRLLKAAACAPEDAMAAASPAMESRAVARWRAAGSGSELAGLVRFCRIGLGFASVLMLAIIALSLRHISKEPAEEFAMPNVIVNLALSQ